MTCLLSKSWAPRNTTKIIQLYAGSNSFAGCRSKGSMLIHLLDLLNAFLTAAAQPEDSQQGATGSETEGIMVRIIWIQLDPIELNIGWIPIWKKMKKNEYFPSNANTGLITPPQKVRVYLARSFLVFPVNKRPLGRGWLIRGTRWLLLMGHMGSWGVPFGSYRNWRFFIKNLIRNRSFGE